MSLVVFATSSREDLDRMHASIRIAPNLFARILIAAMPSGRSADAC